MDALRVRVEVGVTDNFKKKLVRSSLIWVGRMERIGDEKLPKTRKWGERR